MNYVEAITDALNHLNGYARVVRICDYIEKNRTLKYMDTNKNWREQVSNSITTHSSDSGSYKGGDDLFYTKKLGSGYWGLRSYLNTTTGMDEEDGDVTSNYKEGSKKLVSVNAYERNPQARRACINYYLKKNDGRIKCEICGFDFGKNYGSEFEGKIHIHHLIEISSIGSEYKINPTTDLIPICPNCHLIAHSKKPAYSPDEIKAMIRRNR